MGPPLPPSLVPVNHDKQDVVFLGMPGPWAEDNCEAADHYTTKIGGVPDWPMSADEINREMLKCGVCGGELTLVAQIYSPLDSNQIYIEERILYIFGCPALNCGTSPLSWHTIRVQKSSSSEASQSGNINGSTISEGSSSTDGNRLIRADNFSLGEEEHSSDMDEWWDDDMWRHTTDDYEGDDETLDMQELGRALEEAGYMIANQPNGNNSINQIVGIQPSNNSIDNHGDGTLVNGSNNLNTINAMFNNFPVLPCFYIYCQNELYPPRGSSASSNVQLPQNFRVGDNEEFWEAEEYEHGRALSADRTYLKFKKRLDCYPEQCFRYCFGGRPLLANIDQGDPGTCALCGGPRVYEMQLMPPLLYFLQQACKDMPTMQSAINWEWLTIFVYTCAQSCTAERGSSIAEKDWIVVEEATIVHYES